MIIKDHKPYSGPSFTLVNRFLRLLWGVVYLLLFRFSFKPMHSWRSFLLKIFRAKIGVGCHIYPSVKIWAPWNLHLGSYIGIADGVNIYNMEMVVIGDYSVISQGSYLCCGTHDYNASNFQLLAKPIYISDHVWICAEVFIHPGVEISQGIVIGARSVVVHSLTSSWKVYTGNPCQMVGARNNIKREK